jgi:hypothetical protein
MTPMLGPPGGRNGRLGCLKSNAATPASNKVHLAEGCGDVKLGQVRGRQPPHEPGTTLN